MIDKIICAETGEIQQLKTTAKNSILTSLPVVHPVIAFHTLQTCEIHLHTNSSAHPCRCWPIAQAWAPHATCHDTNQCLQQLHPTSSHSRSQ